MANSAEHNNDQQNHARQHPHGGGQGSTQHETAKPENGETGSASMSSSNAGIEERHGEDFEEKDEQKRGGDPDNPSETTGGSESGGEDKGARQ